MNRISIGDLIEARKRNWFSHKDIEKDTEWVEAVCLQITAEGNEHLARELQTNPELLIELTFTIVDKEEDTVPFFLNVVQEDFMQKFNSCLWEYENGLRNSMGFLILKGRQQGFTSLITALQLAYSMLRKNFTGMTIADNADNTHTIFEDKAKYPYNNLPQNFKPTEKYNNRQELHFKKLNSRWRISTAGNKEVGRSKTLRFFHGSEAAFWASISKVMTGLGQSLTKKSIKILESTANGFNEFQQLFSEAVEGENNWIPCFYEWWRTPEYKMEFVSEFQKNKFIEDIETSEKGIFKTCKWLIGFAGLSYEQLHWYYDKWLDLKDLLPQEYPNTPEEAFIATGTMVFDTKKLIERKAELRKFYEENPPTRGKISFEYDENLQIILNDTIRFIECDNGNIWLYEKPVLGYPYCLGGDIAEGGIDFSSGIVTNNITGNEAAVWHDHMDTDMYAKEMYCLGWLYNKALIGIENNYDKHPTKELQRLKYPNLYYRENVDSITKQKIEKYGFLTTSNTRPILIDKLIELVRDNVHLINHLKEIEEMLVFIRNDNGKPCAMDGEHDDLVLGRGISEMVREQGKRTVIVETEEPKGYYHLQELVMLGYRKSQIKRMVKQGKIILIGGSLDNY